MRPLAASASKTRQLYPQSSHSAEKSTRHLIGEATFILPRRFGIYTSGAKFRCPASKASYAPDRAGVLCNCSQQARTSESFAKVAEPLLRVGFTALCASVARLQRTIRSHSAQSVFHHAQVAAKNRFHFFRACGRKNLRNSLCALLQLQQTQAALYFLTVLHIDTRYPLVYRAGQLVGNCIQQRGKAAHALPLSEQLHRVAHFHFR